MSTQHNTIAALLNPSTNTQTSATSAAATTDTGKPETVSYDVAAGKHATQSQLGIDSSPNALITVDGHKVASGDNGLSIDIAPDGSAHVVHGPQDPSQTATQSANGQSSQIPTQYSQAGYDPTGQGQNGTQNGTQHADGTQANGTQPTGTQSTGTQSTGDGTPLTGQLSHTGMTQNGTQPAGYTGGDGTTASGQYGQTGTTQNPSQDTTPVEHLQGIGDHAAKIDLALHGPNSNLPAPVIHTKADGSQDIVIPKGPDNPHAITLHVHPNKDGSYDLTVPKSDTNPHEVKIHVQPDKHVDLNVTQDKDGHIKIDAHDHPADQKDDWSGLQGPAGQNPGYGNGTPVPGQPDQPGESGQKPGADGQPQIPDIPTPKADTPGAGTGGGGGDVPGGGTGGGGDIPGGGTGGDDGKQQQQQYPQQQQQQQQQQDGTLDVDGKTIKDRGSKLVNGPVKTLDTAVSQARDIGVGFPGFGLLGSPLQMIHSSLAETAATELQQGSATLSANSQGMVATGQIYGNAELTNKATVQNTPGTGSQTDGN
ncbi:hypothetical protein [Actinoallomurus iriomotensis]|uniref:Uncharacterized protein n=1 Tax=Actinoallomurus iriomotensis TaxID=478107 RepID=A0A9W6VXA1_9ACTN|nr:hypothetical protein [Actinoallomurus iriomotensis]GLY83645.1 hypothetical protein Airi02_015740 [Actinoallomurus iriomotensis]